jgi:O-antigen/teichoic acid export membrane protein
MVLISISAFIFHVTVSRLLGPSEYGIVVAFVGVLGVLLVPIGALQASISQAVVLKTSQDLDFNLSDILIKVFLCSVLFSFTAAVFFKPFDEFINIKSSTTYFLTLVWFPLAMVSAIFQGVLIGRFKFAYIATATFIGNGILRFAVGISLANNGLGVSGVIIGSDVAQLFICFLLYFYCREHFYKTKDRPQLKIKIKNSLLAVSSFSGCTLFISIDTFMARNLLTAHSSGIYSASATAAHIVFFLPSTLSILFFPRFVGEGLMTKKSKNVFSQSLFITIFSCAIVSILMILFPTFIIQLLFGVGYGESAHLLVYLSIESFFIGVMLTFSALAVARNSLVALTPWVGIAVSVFMIESLPKTIYSFATSMLAASVLMCGAISIMSYRILLRPNVRINLL